VLRPPGVRLILTVLATGMLAGCLSSAPSAPVEAIPESLRGLPITTVALGGRTLRVAVAETNVARQRGLMGVADLGPGGAGISGLVDEVPDQVVGQLSEMRSQADRVDQVLQGRRLLLGALDVLDQIVELR